MLIEIRPVYKQIYFWHKFGVATISREKKHASKKVRFRIIYLND